MISVALNVWVFKTSSGGWKLRKYFIPLDISEWKVGVEDLVPTFANERVKIVKYSATQGSWTNGENL